MISKNIKRKIYIGAFIILGILSSFLAHAFFEIFYIRLLLADFPRYGFGFSWDAWFVIHKIYSIALFILGVGFGWQQGQYWWNYIYVDHKLDRWSRDRN